MCNTNDSLHHLLLHIHCHYSHHFVLIHIVRESSFQLIGRNYWIVLHFILNYNFIARRLLNMEKRRTTIVRYACPNISTSLNKYLAVFMTAKDILQKFGIFNSHSTAAIYTANYLSRCGT